MLIIFAYFPWNQRLFANEAIMLDAINKLLLSYYWRRSLQSPHASFIEGPVHVSGSPVGDGGLLDRSWPMRIKTNGAEQMLFVFLNIAASMSFRRRLICYISRWWWRWLSPGGWRHPYSFAPTRICWSLKLCRWASGGWWRLWWWFWWIQLQMMIILRSNHLIHWDYHHWSGNAKRADASRTVADKKRSLPSSGEKSRNQNQDVIESQGGKFHGEINWLNAENIGLSFRIPLG